ncbi:MAG: nucleoside transporter, partial [Fibrobacter sp.]|nr:nucleoside transporter [Fibrobacter sp.]
LNSMLGIHIDWSLKGLMGYIFYPFTFLLGVAPVDVLEISKIIGERTIATEVAGYQDLAISLSKNLIKEPRSAIIASYALCGFAHVASLAIFVGGVSALVPQKTRELSQIGFRALVAATLACMMTACIAGVFLSGNSLLFGK